MKNILLIGVGGTGSSAVDVLYQKINEFGKQNDNQISALVFDTDAGSVAEISSATVIPMADNASVGTICDRVGNSYLREWFPCDEPAIRSQEMVRGASQWRKKSYLAFLNLMNKQSARSAFTGALEKLALDPSATIEIYVIASIAGGTGSGSFIPIALFAKRYLRKQLGKDPIVNAMIALPDIYADSQTAENKVKIYANAYAILRELNAINLVARGYNTDQTAKKKAPIKFRIGNPEEPNVGVLFDAADPAFWTPDAAPFTQIFVLDRMPGVHSIRAHDIVLANSLYTILCTDIGAQFDSEASNHMTKLSQNNGGNAIYAGISTSQLHYPREAVLDYLAHVKTLESCEGEWLILHRLTEERIHEEEMRAKEVRKRFNMSDGVYASFFLDALRSQYDTPTSAVTDLVDRTTALFDEDGVRLEENAVDSYYKTLCDIIADRFNSSDRVRYSDVLADFTARPLIPRPGLFAPMQTSKDEVVMAASGYYDSLTQFFTSCVDVIRTATTGISDAIFTVDDRKDLRANPALSLVENILMRDGMFIHPVAAMVQLCRLKRKLHDFMFTRGKNEWSELKARSVTELPLRYLPAEEQDCDIDGIRPGKSQYLKMGESRFHSMLFSTQEYTERKTDVFTDSAYLQADAIYTLKAIRADAIIQLQRSVFSRISNAIDVLIAKYRAFFSRFEEAKEDYAEQVKSALKRDAGRIDSIINVLSTEADKQRILKDVFGNTGPMDDAELANAENIAGGGVFRTAYMETVSECSGIDDLRIHSKKNTFATLFGDMTASYRAVIGKSSAFLKYATYNVIQAIEASCGKNPDEGMLMSHVKSYFTMAQELAKPTLLVDRRTDIGDVVSPADIMVVMMSYETAKYIRKRAEIYHLHQSGDQTNEDALIRAAAEEFVRNYSGNDSIRVAIVDGIPDQVLYFTGQIMDITPLRIPKFDELSGDRLYFSNYKKALDNSDRYETDMWNPHIGYNLHKRGYLPFMNAKMEGLCDIQLIKALFYGITHGKILLKKGGRVPVAAFRYMKDGVEHVIFGSDGYIVTEKNIAQLLIWLRNEDRLVDEWSELFDAHMREQKNSLPNAVSESDIPHLERALTNSTIMRMLRMAMFSDTTRTNDADEGDSMGVLEFAYAVKASEESSRDCDDAERILRVASDTFYEMIAHRANPDADMQTFAQVYSQQLNRLLLDFARSSTVQKQQGDSRAYFSRVIAWANSVGAFMDIPSSNMVDSTGRIRIDAPIDTSRLHPDIERALNAAQERKKRESEAQSEDSSSTTVQEAE